MIFIEILFMEIKQKDAVFFRVGAQIPHQQRKWIPMVSSIVGGADGLHRPFDVAWAAGFLSLQ
ncbi:MAG: hypothetical protein Q4B50_01530 [Bacillota bacterium]|nr:hypothetical protein [Bacillota bacterium]